MKVLWAPWRMNYIKDVLDKGEECVFCSILKQNRDEENYVIYRSVHSFIILNRFPYNTGHLMVVANRHVAYPMDLDDEELLDISRMIVLALSILEKEYSPEGYNIGANVGRVAGAGVEKHFHIHIVPRWCGDTNYMPVIARTKVAPESLDETYNRLRRRLELIMKSSLK